MPTTTSCRPHLGVQADGGRRFEYNPRVLDIVRAASRAARSTIAAACRWRPTIRASSPTRGQAYAALGVSLDRHVSRCRPSGAIRWAAAAFHLLGDARTRVNWSAPNTSYVERDAEDRLRGFDDRATTVQTSDAAGRPMLTIRRDYRDLVPLLRHRYEPDNPRVAALRDQPRDVRLTIDAGCSFASPRSSRRTRRRPAARRRRSCSIPIPASCWRARAIRGRRSSFGRRRGDAEGAATRCWIARDTASIRRVRRSSW